RHDAERERRRFLRPNRQAVLSAGQKICAFKPADNRVTLLDAHVAVAERAYGFARNARCEKIGKSKIASLVTPFVVARCLERRQNRASRSEEHTSELQSRGHLVCRLLLEKKKKNRTDRTRLKDKH